MPIAIRETPRAGDSSEESNVRPGRDARQLHKRNCRTDHDAAEQTEREYSAESCDRHHKLGPIIAPEFFQD